MYIANVHIGQVVGMHDTCMNSRTGLCSWTTVAKMIQLLNFAHDSVGVGEAKRSSNYMNNSCVSPS